jgi:hypothetical protein
VGWVFPPSSRGKESNMRKTTIAKDIKKESIYIARNGHSYKFPFVPNYKEVNENPEKFEEYRVKRGDEETEGTKV